MYVPVLKGRAGEFGALQTLPDHVRAELSPVLEVPPVPWDYALDEPAKSLDAHLSAVVPKISKCWGNNLAWLDLIWISADDRLEDGRHPLAAIFNEARAKDLKLVPTTGLWRDEAYQAAVRESCGVDRRGVGVRVQLVDFEDLAAGYQSVGELLASLNCSPENTDLILDLGPVGPDSSAAVLVAVMAILQNLPNVARWRSLVLIGGSFPQNLVGLAPDYISSITREEWRLWRALRQRANVVRRLPTFGDYGVAHPEPSEVDPRIMSPSASIRYTATDNWIVLKRRSLRVHGFEQFHEVCGVLIERPEYSGREFSWGDDHIWKCAHRQDGPGNLTTWRKVGTSHHLVFVTGDLARSGAA